ncbi:MAG: TIGR02147 family protein [Bdellovibrionota bacterium]
MEKRTNIRPDPSAYVDFRRYLGDLVTFLQGADPGFTYRSFAARAGYASPSFLKHVIEGKRNLTPEAIGRFSEALGLSPKEREIFETLVLLGQAKTDAERNLYYARLRKGSGAGKANGNGAARMEKAQYEAYSLWYAFPVYELLRHEDFQEDPEWIAKRLHPHIRPAEAKKALALLEDVGLAVRNSAGRLWPRHRDLATEETVRSLAARNYHRAMLGHAVRAMDTLPQGKRSITSVTVSLTRAQYERARQMVSELEDKLLALAGEERNLGESREVYFAGIQLVPVTGGKKS